MGGREEDDGGNLKHGGEGEERRRNCHSGILCSRRALFHLMHNGRVCSPTTSSRFHSNIDQIFGRNSVVRDTSLFIKIMICEMGTIHRSGSVV